MTKILGSRKFVDAYLEAVYDLHSNETRTNCACPCCEQWRERKQQIELKKNSTP